MKIRLRGCLSKPAAAEGCLDVDSLAGQARISFAKRAFERADQLAGCRRTGSTIQRVLVQTTGGRGRFGQQAA